MMRPTHIAPLALALVILAGCGGGSSGPDIDDSLARGSLYANPPNLVPVPQADGTAATSLQPQAFAQMLEATRPGMTEVTGTPKCAITTYHMKYGTVGGAQEATDATGAIMVPSGDDPACAGPRPVLLYAHGTTVEKSFNMANLRDNAEAALVATTFAAQGFIVVAPNYAGYDVSSLDYHPYLNAQQQADDMVDALRAARKAFGAIAAQDSGQLFIAGYSQGGHVALATQRAMQTTYASEFTVTALAGMSGPYAMALLGDAVFAGSPNLGGTLFLPLVTTSWQNSYGGIYTSTNDIYTAAYAGGIESLFPGDSDFAQLVAAGKLPQLAMFAADSAPGPTSPSFAPFFGAGYLVNTGFRDAYLADMAQNPCNQDAAAPLNCAPALPLRAASVENDLRNFLPAAPVLLCGGNADPAVFFASTQAIQTYFLSNGLPAAALTVLDVDSAPDGAGDAYAAAKIGFGQARDRLIADAIAAGRDPAAAVTGAYHGTLVPPFCNVAARGYFQSIMALQQSPETGA
jgi:hypothetical protein